MMVTEPRFGPPFSLDCGRSADDKSTGQVDLHPTTMWSA